MPRHFRGPLTHHLNCGILGLDGVLQRLKLPSQQTGRRYIRAKPPTAIQAILVKTFLASSALTYLGVIPSGTTVDDVNLDRHVQRPVRNQAGVC
eukprot:4346212-Pyramimonas_sp.AAC.2